MTLSDPVARAHAMQKTAADPALSVFVTANAGSGKTTTLVNRVARLLLKRVKPDAILCVTYTKAAAAEMQARLFDKLGRWAVADDRELADELAALDDRDPAALSDRELSEARVLFARALETPGGLKIQTIHAFCEKLLRRFPLEAGVAPGFEVLEDQAAQDLSRAAREDLARAALADGDGRLGRAYAWFAVHLFYDAFHALLGEIEARREALNAYLLGIADGTRPSPYHLLGVRPEETVEALSDDFMRGIDREEWRATADALDGGSTNDRKCADRMRAALEMWTFEGLGPVFLTEGAPRKSLVTRGAPAAAAEWLNRLADRYAAALDRVRAARVAQETMMLLTLADAHHDIYEAAKRDRGALDFTDLVARTADLLTRRASAAWVLYKLDGGIDHVLIDEAQDTAPEQWAIVRALTGPFFSGEGVLRPDTAIDRTVFAVGDEKQSIYSFQGARPDRLREERRDYLALVENAGFAFAGPDLNTSFRSTKEVLEFVDAVFQPADRARALVGETGDILPHLPARSGQTGSVELWPLFEDPVAPEREAWNAPVDKEDAHSARKKLARALARDIRRQVETGVGVWTVDADRRPVLRPARWGDFLVLVRRRDATFEEVIRALKTEGVPVAGADRLKLKAHIVNDDLTALARFALFPDDDLSLAEILRSPFCDVADFGPPDALFPLADRKAREGRSLWAELQRRAGEQPAWAAARDLMDDLIAARDRDPFAFFSLALNRIGPDGRSGRARILDRLGREAEEAIDETLAQVLAAEARGGRDLETCLFLLEQAEVEVKREMEGARNEVRVMTVHGSKGLEAPVVILPDTTARAKPQGPTLLPASLPDGGEAWLMCPSSARADCPVSAEVRQARVDRTEAEYLRLLYVALTRARDRLVIMGRKTRSPKEGFEPGSWWDVIAGTFALLAERDPKAVRVLEGGRLRFGPAPGAVAPQDAAARDRTALPDWVRRPAPAAPDARALSPSRMEGGSIRVPAPSPLSTGGADLGRFRRGDLIHRLLERLPDLPPPDRPAAAVRLLSRERDVNEAQREEMIAAAFSVLDDPRFAPVFGPGSRAEAAISGGAPALGEGVVISGRIDRLVIAPDRVLVVDYKTNRPAPDRIEDADPAYVRQMAAYVAVLAQLYPDRPVEAALVWTDGPKLMAVPQALMDQALAAVR